MSDLVGKEIHGIFRTKKPAIEQTREYKRSEKDLTKYSRYSSKT